MVKESKEDYWARLMREALLGNKRSYEVLLKDLSLRLDSFVRKRLINKNDSQDVVQEILISIHHAKNTYDTNKPFSPWVFTIAQYRFIDYLRKNRSRMNLEVSDEQFFENLRQPDDLDSEEDVRKDRLEKALEEIPEKYKQVIVLLKYEEKTIKEAAEILGQSEANIKVIAHRAYKKLKDLLWMEL